MNKIIIQLLTQLKNKLNIEANNFLINSDNKNYVIYKYKIKVIINAITVITRYDKKITLQNVDELLQYNNIGKKTVEKIKEILQTGTLEALKDIPQDKSNNVIKELETVYGIGKYTAFYLYNKKQITSVKDLIKKVKNGDIKVNKDIYFGLMYYKKFFNNIPRKEVDLYNKELQKIKICKTIICGSYRRKKEFMSDIDVLIICNNDKYTINNYIEEIINNKNLTIIENITTNHKLYYRGLIKYKDFKTRKIEITFTTSENIWSHLLHLTGSAEFNKYMRTEAKKLGYKLSQYGLYKNNKKIIINSEEEIFKILNIPYLDPTKRI